MPSLSKSLKFQVETGLTSTGTSVAVAYPIWYSVQTTTTQYVTSFPDQGAGYYGTTNGLHSLTVNTSPNFLGTATIQASLATAPTESDWFDVVDGKFEYTTTSTGYIPSLIIDLNPATPDTRTRYLNFTGQFTWIRSQVQVDQGALTSIKYNY